MFLNSDGINYNLIKTLWEEHNKMWCNLNLNLPHSVIFCKSKPAAWFFTNKRGKIRKKRSIHVNEENVLKIFTNRPKNDRYLSDIVGYYIYDTKGKASKTEIIYFDEERLSNKL